MACLFVDHLSVLDFAYLDPARGLVGESWIADLELEGDLDRQSMVLDFGEVKRRIKRILDSSGDHTLVIPGTADDVIFEEGADGTRLLFPSTLGAIEHVAPACAVTVLACAEVTPAALAAHIEQQVRPELPPSVEAIRLRLRPEAINGAWYHYTHGLKKHDGACQRIAHGHRSRIEVRIDGERAEQIESDIALRWTDIYLGSREDVLSHANGRIRFGYDAPEGRFELCLPEHRVDLLEGDSTVECIADHLWQQLRRRIPDGPLEVRAYEGVNKGAVARG